VCVCVFAVSCSTDYVELFSLMPRRRRTGRATAAATTTTATTTTVDLISSLDDMDAVLLGRYCGLVLPGPQLSDERSSVMRVVFTSNQVAIKTGFRAKYEFVDKKPAGGKRAYIPQS